MAPLNAAEDVDEAELVVPLPPSEDEEGDQEATPEHDVQPPHHTTLTEAAADHKPHKKRVGAGLSLAVLPLLAAGAGILWFLRSHLSKKAKPAAPAKPKQAGRKHAGKQAGTEAPEAEAAPAHVEEVIAPDAFQVSASCLCKPACTCCMHEHAPACFHTVACMQIHYWCCRSWWPSWSCCPLPLPQPHLLPLHWLAW